MSLTTLEILNEALVYLKNSYEETKTLNGDITEFLEQMNVIKTLPECLRICQLKHWRPNLLAKLNMKLFDYEDEYNRHIVNLETTINTIQNNGFSLSHISSSFSMDLRCVYNFFLKVTFIATKNRPFRSETMVAIPEIPFNVEQALERLRNDLKIVLKA